MGEGLIKCECSNTLKAQRHMEIQGLGKLLTCKFCKGSHTRIGPTSNKTYFLIFELVLERIALRPLVPHLYLTIFP